MPVTKTMLLDAQARHKRGELPDSAWQAILSQAKQEAATVASRRDSTRLDEAASIGKAVIPPLWRAAVLTGDSDPAKKEEGYAILRSMGRGGLTLLNRALGGFTTRIGPTTPIQTPWGVSNADDEALAAGGGLGTFGAVAGGARAVKALSGVTKATKAVPAYKAILSRPTALLEGFASGKAFNRLANVAEDVTRKIESEGLVQMEDVISDLSRSEKKWARDNFRTAFREGSKMPTENLQKLADTWGGVSKWIADQAKDAGLDFGKQSRYLPDYWTDETVLAFEARKGAVWEAIVDWAKREKGIGEDELNGIVERIMPRDGSTPIRKSSSLEFRKVLGLPDELPVDGKAVKLVDSDALSNMGKYIRDSSRRIGIVSSFGQDDSVIRSILDATGADPTARKLIKDQWKALQGVSDSPGFYESGLGRAVLGMESAGRALQLSGSVVSNTMGWMQAAQKYGFLNTLRAQGDVVKAWGADKFKPSWFKDSQLRVDMARLEGGWSRHTLDRLAQTEGFGAPIGASQKVGKAAGTALKLTGLELVERNTNKLSALAAQQYVADTFNRLRKGGAGGIGKIFGTDAASLRRSLQRDFQWTDGDINRIMRSGMSDLDRVRVSRLAPAMTNAFAESARVRPTWMRHPLAQRSLAYTSFVRIRGNMASDALKEAFGHGNVKPIAKLLGYGVLAGEAEIALKGWFKDRERVDKDFKHRLFNDLMASATFGYLGPVYEDAKYAATSRGTIPEKIGEFVDDTIVPPFVSTIKEIAEFLTTKQTAEQTARQMAPAADIAIAQARKIFTPEEAAKQRRIKAKKAKQRMKATPLP